MSNTIQSEAAPTCRRHGREMSLYGEELLCAVCEDEFDDSESDDSREYDDEDFCGAEIA